MSVLRRPITKDERPHVVAVGRRVRELRQAAGMTQVRLAALATISAGQVSAIERGASRTRRSTLERMLRPLVHEDAIEMELDELVGMAGPVLALEIEEAWAERVRLRSERRERRHLPEALKAARAHAKQIRRHFAGLPSTGPNAAVRVRLIETADRHVEELEARLAEMRPAVHEDSPPPTASAMTSVQVLLAEVRSKRRR